jgi:hypothetical protein
MTNQFDGFFSRITISTIIVPNYSFGYEHITEEGVDTMIARGRATQISANLI